MSPFLSVCDCEKDFCSFLFCTVLADIRAVSHEPRLKNENENDLSSRSDSSPHKHEDVDKVGLLFYRLTMYSKNNNNTPI